ncbi:hypothetical protein NQ318_012869 [Aromia moschata]|uniref:OSK domain-containing protein n=1 Tax=Aromia moschata TaxID=1265417 RepID=A0AAV8YBV3_9CUCU|nr:hypothetical protein NQ318_012869 [Aromia moschata]
MEIRVKDLNIRRDSEIITSEEREITKILISIICLYGNDGLPLNRVNDEFRTYCGFDIPFQKFGAETYVKQKPNLKPQCKRKNSEGTICHKNFKRQKHSQQNKGVPKGSFIHTSINNTSINGCDRFEKFNELTCLFRNPCFHYYISIKLLDRKECGLCTVGQTISGLTEKVRNTAYLAPRVVVMIGFQDLQWGRNVNNMIYDLRQLVIELKKRNTRVTLITLIPSPKLPKSDRLQTRMEIFNKAILDYACDNDLKCNVIDMYKIFIKEAEFFRKDFDRFIKVTKKDPYKVFSDYGRKIFLSALKVCLKEQIEAGH